ncbi:RNA methyltransferase [Rubritalea profundi]|nr:RNA methyltransferase [Rubritalea profundi]
MSKLSWRKFHSNRRQPDSDQMPSSISAPPVIILVETQLGENIGMCARAMLNCGLNQLRLVRPRDGWPNERARATAADADIVLENAKIYDNIDDAIGDCQRVFAATARQRTLKIPGLDLREAVGEIVDATPPPKTAILFGPEASGLDNETLSRADRLIHFPTNPDFPSLNLAQAVLLFGWEWRQSRSVPSAPITDSNLLATREETKGFLSRLEQALDESKFFLTPDQRPSTLRNLRAFLTRSRVSDEELRMLHGVLTALKKN